MHAVRYRLAIWHSFTRTQRPLFFLPPCACLAGNCSALRTCLCLPQTLARSNPPALLLPSFHGLRLFAHMVNFDIGQRQRLRAEAARSPTEQVVSSQAYTQTAALRSAGSRTPLQHVAEKRKDYCAGRSHICRSAITAFNRHHRWTQGPMDNSVIRRKGCKPGLRETWIAQRLLTKRSLAFCPTAARARGCRHWHLSCQQQWALCPPAVQLAVPPSQPGRAQPAWPGLYVRRRLAALPPAARSAASRSAATSMAARLAMVSRTWHTSLGLPCRLSEPLTQRARSCPSLAACVLLGSWWSARNHGRTPCSSWFRRHTASG